jgi:hypothetical protein
MRSWLLLTVLAAGCWGERAPGQTTPAPSLAAVERPPQPWPSSARPLPPRRTTDRCAQVVAHVFEVARQDAPNVGLAISMLDDLQETMIESCHETEWSEDILGCYAGTTSMAETSNCFRAMSTEQRDDFDRRFSAIRQRHRSGSPPPPSPSPPPPPSP